MTIRRFNVLMLVAIVAILIAMVATPAFAAEDTTIAFDNTYVLDDLISSTVNGKAFSLVDYPYIEGAKIRVLSVVEYAYSPKAYMRENYGLYLYLYNPGAIQISGNSKLNKVQLAVSYNEKGEPNDYDKFDLKLCSAVYEGDYKGLFYKYKVVDKKGADSKTVAERVNSNERRYDISGVELLTVGSSNATEYAVGATYKFSGYAKGYGVDTSAESTLTCTADKLRTVTLDVNQTYYRFNNGVNVSKQINSCYFSVDSNFIKEFGRLQRIKAEWWEYRTTPIIVTSDNEMYMELLSHVGEVVIFDKNIGYTLNCGSSSSDYFWVYNDSDFSGLTPEQTTEHILKKIANIFYTNGEAVSDYILRSETLLDYAYSYSKGNGVLPIKDGNISTDLFTENVGDGRTAGYNCIDKDADDLFTLNAFDGSSFSSWWYSLFHDVETSAKRDIKPIFEVQAKDLAVSDETLSSNLMIAKEDVSSFRAYCNSTFLKGEKVYLFRYAVSDYNLASIEYWNISKVFNTVQRGKAYAAEENVFFDFDIIQLTFNADGVYTVIPVVSSPVDVVSDIEPPLENTLPDKLKKILGIIIAVILIVILLPLLPTVIKFIVWVVTLPFKLIGRGIKRISKSVKKKE